MIGLRVMLCTFELVVCEAEPLQREALLENAAPALSFRVEGLVIEGPPRMERRAFQDPGQAPFLEGSPSTVAGGKIEVSPDLAERP